MLATTTTNQSSETRLSVSWLDYYRNNRESLLEIPWGRGAEISDLERAAIGGSIREFQMGFARFWKSCWREMNEAMRHVRSGPKFAPGRSDLASVA